MPSITPLKGAEPFSNLMRTRPLAAWGSCLVHVIATPTESTPQFELGLIVPKKAYALAVDRNRIRRVLRAQCQALAKETPCTVQLLFRIKTGAKKSEKAKPLAATNINPHSAAFTKAVKHGLKNALLAAQTQTPVQKTIE